MGRQVGHLIANWSESAKNKLRECCAVRHDSLGIVVQRWVSTVPSLVTFSAHGRRFVFFALWKYMMLADRSWLGVSHGVSCSRPPGIFGLTRFALVRFAYETFTFCNIGNCFVQISRSCRWYKLLSLQSAVFLATLNLLRPRF